MKIFPLTLFALLLFLPTFVCAQELEIFPGDEQLVIKGWIGDDASFVGDVRVVLRGVAQGTAAPKLSILSAHLKRADGDQINRQQVTLTTEVALTPDLPTNIPIKITGVKNHGDYIGNIQLLLAGQPFDKAKTIVVTVKSAVRPTLSLLTERVKTNFISCTSPCWLAEALVPGSTVKKLELRFEKPIGASVAMPDQTFEIRGEKTGFQLSAAHLKLGQPIASLTSPPVPPATSSATPAQPTDSIIEKRFITLPIELNYSELPPDHYVGSISLAADGQGQAIKVPVDVSVAVAPLWPLMFLVGGILLGKLSKYMQEKGAPAADALVAYHRVELRVSEAHEDDQNILRPQLDSAHKLITEDQAAQAIPLIKLIDVRLACLNELRTIEGRMAGKEEHPTVKAILGQIQQARERTRQGDDEVVKTLLKDIKDALVTLSTTMMSGENEPDRNIVLASASATTAAAAADRIASIAPAAPQTRRHRIRQLLAKLSGISDDFRAEASLWLLRPLLWLVLILSLIALGMKSLYVDNPIFGASSFDYLSLVFWGLSSDVASRTLGSLKIGGGDA